MILSKPWAMPLHGRRSERPSEAIAGAAIRYSDLGTLGLPLPASHEQIERIVERQHGSRTGKHQGERGFITRSGRFVNSRQALIIARRARQLRRTPLRGHDLQLEYLLRPDQMPDLGRAGRPRADKQMASPDQLGRHLLRHCLVATGLAALIALLLLAPAAASVAAAFPSLGSGAASTAAVVSALLLGLGLGIVLDARGARFRGPALSAGAATAIVTAFWAVAVGAGLGVVACTAALGAGLLVPVLLALVLQVRPVAALLALPFLAATELALVATFALFA